MSYKVGIVVSLDILKWNADQNMQMEMEISLPAPVVPSFLFEVRRPGDWWMTKS